MALLQWRSMSTAAVVERWNGAVGAGSGDVGVLW